MMSDTAMRAPGDSRLRVLQTIGTMHIGGAENVVVELAQGLDPDRFDVHLCCTKEGGVLAERVASGGIPVHLAAPPSRRLRHLTPFYLDRVIRRLQPDIIHSHGTPALLHVAPLAALRRVPRWIHTFHYGRYDTVQGRQIELERRLCRLADDLVAVSEAQRQSLLRRYALDPARIQTITNGVRFDPPSAESVASARAGFGLGPSDRVVGCIAVLSEQKGISYLLQAAAALAPRFPRVRFLVVGGGPLESRLRSEATALGLSDRVTFTGWRTGASGLLPLFDVWVMSSLWEAMPMALVEAMAAGVAIVTTDVGDNRSIVGNGNCATIVHPSDARALEHAIATLLEHPDRARAQAARATERYRALYTTSHMVARYEALFDRV